MQNSVYVDFHVIQTVPPSCVNRDDTGSPKMAVYGGVERARVSSQAWKHAMREDFKTIFAPEQLGSRTKQIPMLLASAIQKKDNTLSSEKALKKAMEVLKTIGIKTDEKKNENSALLFISKKQVEMLAEAAVVGDKEAYKQAIKDYPAIDIALFGRMVADDPSLNYDAASQVAHAISTHKVETEYDYFTAVDDERAEDKSGAGHLGTVEFNSSTLYRYATVNISELKKHLGEDTAKAVRGFAEAFICSMPTGKQNTFANRTLPDMVYLTIRRDQPVNLSGAFECAVKNDKKEASGFVKRSCEALINYAGKIYDSFAEKPERAFGCGERELLSDYAEVMPLKQLLNCLEECTVKICHEDSV